MNVGTFNNTKFFENSYENQPYSAHSSFVPRNTSPHSGSCDFYSTPACDQVDNSFLEFIRETHEVIRISRKRMEELKLEMENFKSEQETEVNNSKFHEREGKRSTLLIENPQTSKSSLLFPSLSEKQENINFIPRVILGEESSNIFLGIF